MTAQLTRRTGRRPGLAQLVRLAPALTGAALVVTLAACGGSDGVAVTDPGAAPSTSASASTGTGTKLTIVVHDASKTSTWTLTCDPTGGDHPHADKACAALAADKGKALQPVAGTMMCTQLYGGPQTAEVTGSYAGTAVTSSFSRKNGCEIARWKALTGLLPAEATGPM